MVILSYLRPTEGAIGTHGYYLVVPTGTLSVFLITYHFRVRTSSDVTLITNVPMYVLPIIWLFSSPREFPLPQAPRLLLDFRPTNVILPRVDIDIDIALFLAILNPYS